MISLRQSGSEMHFAAPIARQTGAEVYFAAPVGAIREPVSEKPL
jgi:hypothetical protein